MSILNNLLNNLAYVCVFGPRARVAFAASTLLTAGATAYTYLSNGDEPKAKKSKWLVLTGTLGMLASGAFCVRDALSTYRRVQGWKKLYPDRKPINDGASFRALRNTLMVVPVAVVVSSAVSYQLFRS